jgi:hypothetical protein
MKTTVPAKTLAIASLIFFSSGCFTVVERPYREVAVVDSHKQGPPPWAPAHGWRRKHETYYYYPRHQVYYYPHQRKYYWIDGGQWRYGSRLPRHYIIEEHKRVVLELDYEPHHHHHKIKNKYRRD